MYEPAMRHLIDTYIQAEESEKVSAFDDMSLIQLIVERGAAAVDALPDRIKKNKEAVAEAIENNVRKLIIDEQPINPKYYEKMSELLDALIEQRRKEALDYQEYLRRIVELTKKVTSPEASGEYPARMNSPGKRALYDNLDKDEGHALGVDAAVRASRQDDWRSNPFKIRRVKNAIRVALEELGAQAGVVLEAPAAYETKSAEPLEERVDRIFALVKNQDEY
jgi:type I restriction enzyme R subunit